MNATSYTLQEIHRLPKFDHIEARALNNLGQVVGDSFTTLSGGFGVGRAFFWSRGTEPEELRSFGENSRALAINDLGDVVGWAEETRRTGLGDDDEEQYKIPVLWVGSRRQRIPSGIPLRLSGDDSGMARTLNNRCEVLGTPDSRWTVSGNTMKHQRLAPPPMPKGHRFLPTGINNEGTIVGYSYRPTDTPLGFETQQQAWLRIRGHWKKLSPEAKTSAALGLNDRNELVGWVSPTGKGSFPMLWRETTPQPLSEQEGIARAINAQGAIVGDTRRESRGWACLWQEGKAIDLETLLATGPKPKLYDAVAINDKGQILISEGYLLTPK